MNVLIDFFLKAQTTTDPLTEHLSYGNFLYHFFEIPKGLVHF